MYTFHVFILYFFAIFVLLQHSTVDLSIDAYGVHVYLFIVSLPSFHVLSQHSPDQLPFIPVHSYFFVQFLLPSFLALCLLLCKSTVRVAKPESNYIYEYTYLTNKTNSDFDVSFMFISL